MTRERAKELLPVIQAWAEGKAVQCRGRYCSDNWGDSTCPTWRDDFDYRIKPEPREWWVNVYPGDSAGNLHNTKEHADSHSSDRRIACIKVREVME